MSGYFNIFPACCFILLFLDVMSVVLLGCFFIAFCLAACYFYYSFFFVFSFHNVCFLAKQPRLASGWQGSVSSCLSIYLFGEAGVGFVVGCASAGLPLISHFYCYPVTILQTFRYRLYSHWPVSGYTRPWADRPPPCFGFPDRTHSGPGYPSRRILVFWYFEA